jgi:hypothetical protein
MAPPRQRTIGANNELREFFPLLNLLDPTSGIGMWMQGYPEI